MSCWCDVSCAALNDCCPDYKTECSFTSATAQLHTNHPTTSPPTSALPTTPAPTMTPTTIPASTTAAPTIPAEQPCNSRVAACGKAGLCSGEGEYDGSALHAVRCCADTWKSGFVQAGGCAAWTSSLMCESAHNFSSAQGLCLAAGARLCTQTELEENCAAGTGCGFDKHTVWSATEAASCNAHANQPPPSPNTVPSALPCSALPGFLFRQGNIDVCGGSPSCVSVTTHAAAQAHCTSIGARLCTEPEVQAKTTQGTGCNFDQLPIWTNTLCPDGALRTVGKGGGAPSCLALTSNTDVAVRCCADKY